MVFTYTNFQNDVYYLHSRQTKKGKTTYYFSKKNAGSTVDEMPEGFEIYEEPNGKVYIRKPLKKLIHDEELETIQKGMEQHCSIKNFKLDVKEKWVYIYTAGSPEDSQKISILPPGFDISQYKHFETEMRFGLEDDQDRLFVVERFCYLGGVDDWIYLESSNDLSELVKQYVRHLGQESLYDLEEI